MNNEIKEILDRIETASEIFDCLLKPEECTEILDLITNLQQENESLRTRIKTIKRLRKKQTQKKNKYKSIIFDEEQKLKDYKSRIDKAVEYINKEFKDEPYSVFIYGKTNIDKLLNILQNGSENNE